jgi:hypothetical protein
VSQVVNNVTITVEISKTDIVNCVAFRDGASAPIRGTVVPVYNAIVNVKSPCFFSPVD